MKVPVIMQMSDGDGRTGVIPGVVHLMGGGGKN